ncbi:ABC transporter permease [Kitasatospora phosalacinea]|uniref:ABC transporter permease n=1 Tax=Kitasatospora phosalacinea TaxID=2065 RepID=UPI0005250D2F|nr:ABC transporter permease [Kitasatospora phosalacinea]
MNARADTRTHPLRAEWAKFTTLRPLWTVPFLAVALSAGITAAVQAAYGNSDTSLTEDPMEGLYYGLNFGQVAVACLGILLVGQEYASGTLATSLAAVPDRLRFYRAKLLLGAGLGLAVGLVTVGCQLAATAATVGLDPSDPGTARALVAGVLYHPLLLVLCLALTTVLRNQTAALGLLSPAVFLGTTALAAVPGVREAARFLPDRAGQYALRLADTPGTPYGHTTGLLLMAAWTLAAAWAGLRTLRREDA